MAKKSLLLIFLLSGVLAAQTNRGTISGTVSDSSGAVIAGATVKITNAGTNQSFTIKTADNGTYEQTQLDPVYYTVAISQPGFKEKVVSNVKVDTAGNVRLDVALNAGDVTTKVEVNAGAEVLNTESATLASTVSERQIQDLPLPERSVFSLAQLVPNVSGDYFGEEPVVTQTLESPGAGFSVNGGRLGSTTILADGANNTAVGIGRAVSTFSPDVVQEFTVQTSAFSAEYGTTGGGVINVTTKSGTNEFHGELYGFFRNPYFNADPYTTQTTSRPVSERRQTQAGFLLGGPVIIPKLYHGRNKTFFFFAFEPQWVSDGSEVSDLVPTTQMLQGNFSGAVDVTGGVTTAAIAQQYGAPVTGDATIYDQFNMVGNQLQRLPAPASGQTYVPFPNNTIPQSMLDPVALKILQHEPPAGAYSIISGSLQNWISNRTVIDREQRYNLRLDHNLTDNNRLTFRDTHIPLAGYRYAGNQSTDSSQVNSLQSDQEISDQYVLSDTWILSPTKVNDLRLNAMRANYSHTNPPDWLNQNLSTQLGLPSLTAGGLPFFRVLGGTDWGAIGQRSISSLGNQVDESFNISDTLSWTRGTQTIKFGADLRQSRMNIATVGYASGGQYAFSTDMTSSAQSNATGGIPLASFLLGVPDNINLANTEIPYYYQWNTFTGFVQDDWRVKPNLTFNLGLRYSVQTPRTEKYNHQGSFLLDQAQTVQLPKAITLPTGQVITTALEPPFAYDGYGGRSPYLEPIDWMGLEPRFGFAWTPGASWNHDNRFVVRGGYGISHAPLTDVGNTATPNFAAPSATWNTTTGQENTAYVTRLSSNPPVLNPMTPAQVLNIPSNGLVTTNSLAIPGFVITSGFKNPYVQNWNVTLGMNPGHGFAIEVAYVGSKGTHLFDPPQDVNLCPFADVEGYINQGLNPWTSITDPLGRKSVNGTTLSIPTCSQAEPYLGFDQLMSYLTTDANSIRHAGYVSVNRRLNHGLYFTGSYTFGKSIDDASDNGSTLTATNSQTAGQSAYGAAYSSDRSVSTFDVKNLIVGTAMWDLPFGRDRQWLASPPKLVGALVSGWTISGTGRIQSGFPFTPLLTFDNLISGASDWAIRPNIVPGVPLVNPNYNSNCQISGCEPYVNPSLFELPPEGQFGDAPRTMDDIRGPLKKYLNLSLQKNFSPFKDSKKRVQLRVDAINAFNHPVFGFNNYGNGRMMTQPSGSAISASDYNTWALANNQPLSSTTAGAAQMAQIQSLVTSNYLPGTTLLPPNFFSVPLPQGFATAAATSYNITTLQGFKDFRLRQAFNTSFGTFSADPNPSEQQRFVQFSVKIFF
jgi:hypothetical protein